MTEKIEWGTVDENGLLHLPEDFMQKNGVETRSKIPGAVRYQPCRNKSIHPTAQ